MNEFKMNLCIGVQGSYLKKKTNSLLVSYNEKEFEKQTQRDSLDPRKGLKTNKNKTYLV